MKKIVFTFACFVSLSAAYAATSTGTIPQITKKTSLADSVNLADYVGKYKMQGLPFDYITIGLKEGKLTISTGDQDGTLTPLKEADKFDANGQATLQFVRDADKKVTGMKLDAQGMAFDGKKES
ncbi:DUF3471 domain-containing protein [Spirosoma arboris]|nr:DUF3471 domain-containing protein [Spirosoma arboris]